MSRLSPNVHAHFEAMISGKRTQVMLDSWNIQRRVLEQEVPTASSLQDLKSLVDRMYQHLESRSHIPVLTGTVEADFSGLMDTVIMRRDTMQQSIDTEF